MSHRSAQTSLEAYHTHRPEPARARVIAYLVRCDNGATHEEISAGSGVRHDTVKATIHHLGQEGVVAALKKTRPTSTGRRAMVFVLVSGTSEGLDPSWPPPHRDSWKERALRAEALALELRAELDELKNIEPRKGLFE
jgi:predicted ArsR family transcriptional regulator